MTSRVGVRQALLRLIAVQGVWSNERMHGVGMAWAAQPLLEDLGGFDPQRLAEARVRSAEPFNCHPHLAGVALGAEVRAEFDGVPGTQIARLRLALGGPLGALGDQFFWAGLVPLLAAAALALTAVGLGPWPVLGFVVIYNGIRIAVARWSLRVGLEHGTAVGAAMQTSWLPGAAAGIGPWAGLAMGLAVPLVGRWLLVERPVIDVGATVAVAVVTVAGAWRLRARLSPIRLALVLVAGVLLVRLGAG